jgi:hypothetical protein
MRDPPFPGFRFAHPGYGANGALPHSCTELHNPPKLVI